MYAFCWSLLRIYFAMHRSKNVVCLKVVNSIWYTVIITLHCTVFVIKRCRNVCKFDSPNTPAQRNISWCVITLLLLFVTTVNGVGVHWLRCCMICLPGMNSAVCSRTVTDGVCTILLVHEEAASTERPSGTSTLLIDPASPFVHPGIDDTRCFCVTGLGLAIQLSN
jgi:hypothetical protein